MQTISIYIHIPFCIKKCFYCDFLSVEKNLYEIYVNALIEEIKCVSDKLKEYVIKTIFIGGGTPTVLSTALIEKIISAVKNNFLLDDNLEFSIESNPGTLTNENLFCFKELGINRLSIGLQASQNNLLAKLGRIHNFQQFYENYLLAKKVGINNINVDLMFSLPSQSQKDWEDTLDVVISLNPTHISAYSLTIEENTPFAKKQLDLPSDEFDREAYKIAKQKLNSAGFVHYEISNFAKKNYECKHNLAYWKCNDYIGMGLGAHSLFNSVRYNNITDLDTYIKNNGNMEKNICDKIYLNTHDRYSEFMFMGLRLIDGITEQEFFDRFNLPLCYIYGQQLEKLISLNLIENIGHRYSLTSMGLDLSNVVFREFI